MIHRECPGARRGVDNGLGLDASRKDLRPECCSESRRRSCRVMRGCMCGVDSNGSQLRDSQGVDTG